jgi:hypothetical protein
MIASNMIILITLLFLLAFAVSTLFLYLKFPKNRGVKFFGVYFLFFLLGLILTSLRNKIPDFISLQIGISVFAVGYMFLYMGLKNIVGQDSHWYHRYFIPIGVLFIGIFLFTYVQYDLHMRIIIFSFYITIYTLVTAWIFYKASAFKFKIINRIASIIYVAIAFVFLVRALNATTMSNQIGVKYSMEFIVNAPYISLCIMSLVLILVSNVYLRMTS